ncbi:MAG: pyridoxal-dependent decarboxylase [Xanthomonadales bacterium]|nr:pyridoxal-dependent decarboxylase [Xanthomonadales bacterium]
MEHGSAQDIGSEFRAEIEGLTERLKADLSAAFRELDTKVALPQNADEALAALEEPLPIKGCGMQRTLDALLEFNRKAGANTGGPKCFHFVIGGSTPAAVGADLLATVYETIPYTWVISPLGVRMELQALKWLREMFGLPLDWSGVMVTGASMANLVCLASARQWWAEQLGFDVADRGLAGLPQMPVLSSGYVHASSRKVLGLLGVGYNQVSVHARDSFGRVDLEAMARHLESLDGTPAVMIVNAGEVNAGDFDPVNAMIDLAREHNVWVHVDGAFGLFARLSPRTAHLVEGVERADSVTVDGHKWLNVPYDSGYAFVRDHALMSKAFRYAADYLPAEDDPRPTLGAIGPESSRRGRCFAVWATLKAYGREGHARIVEHCLDLAQHAGRLVEDAPDLELMAPVQLNIVPFRYVRPGLDDEQLDRLNRKLGEEVLADGRFLVGTSRLGARTIFRPAFSNWRTRLEDVQAFISVVRELGRAA